MSSIDHQFETYIRSTYTNDLYQSLNADNFTEQDFNEKYGKIAIENLDLSVFHLNIRSLNANSSKLIQLLDSLDLKFNVIILSEIWGYHIQFYNNVLPNYTFLYDLPSTSAIGGVGIFVHNTLKFKLCPELKVQCKANYKVENLWIELETQNKKYIVGGIYRHPNQSIEEFQNNLDVTLQKINLRKIPAVIAGDINIDVLKYKNNNETLRYVDNLLAQNILPVSLLPTRVTEKTATIIDHIYYTPGKKIDPSQKLFTGNILCDITDHYGNYIILYNRGSKVNTEQRPSVRLFTNKSKISFMNDLCKINWNGEVLLHEDPSEAYNNFHKLFAETYETNFPLTKVSRRGYRDKHWITPGLKIASRRKNSLYLKWLQSRNPADNLKYKQYKKHVY